MTDAIKSFSPIRMTASTEDAAVSQALQIVGVAREDVSVEVLSQDAKGVTVRVSPRKENDAPVAASDAISSTQSVAASEEQAASEEPDTYISTNVPGEIAAATDEPVDVEPVDVEAAPDAEAPANGKVDELKTVEDLQDILPTLPADQTAIEPVAVQVVEADEQSKESARALWRRKF